MTTLALDIGNMHVIDWYLYRERLRWSAPMAFLNCLAIKQRLEGTLRFDPEDWSRYDGELL